MKAEVAHFTTEQMVDMVGLLSPCMDDYLYVCDFKEDYYQISPNAVKRFCLQASSAPFDKATSLASSSMTR